jgi:magnesium transporter
MRKIPLFKPGVWVDVIDPKENEVKFLNKLGIDASFIEDALDPDELPRIEKEKGSVYAILNIPQWEKGKVSNIPLLVVIARNYFATISKQEVASLSQILKHPTTYTTQKTKNLLKICHRITELYAQEIRRINKEINAKKVSLSELKNEDIIVLVEFEEILNDFITSIVALIGVFEKIRSGKYVRIYEEDEHLLEDLIIDSNQSLDMARTSIRKIVNMREAYSTILSNNLNKVLKFLTSLALIMGVPTIIASIYGMNVRLPLQNHPFAFSYVMVFTLLVSAILFLVFYIKKWL